MFAVCLQTVESVYHDQAVIRLGGIMHSSDLAGYTHPHAAEGVGGSGRKIAPNKALEATPVNVTDFSQEVHGFSVGFGRRASASSFVQPIASVQ